MTALTCLSSSGPVFADSNFWLMVFTAVLAACTAASAIAAYLQYRAIQRQEHWMRENVQIAKDGAKAAQGSADAANKSADIAKDALKVARTNARRTLRARVYVSSAVLIGEPRPGEFIAELTVKNFGTLMPAHRCTFRAAIYLWPSPTKEFPKLNPSADDPRIVLPPGGEVKNTYRIPGESFTDKQQQLVSMGAYAFFIQGAIEYRNGFRQDRRSEFLMRCSGPDYQSGRFAFCAHGNHAN